MKNLAQGFNTAAQDSNPDSLSRKSEALPRSHCALHAIQTETEDEEHKRLNAPVIKSPRS